MKTSMRERSGPRKGRKHVSANLISRNEKWGDEMNQGDGKAALKAESITSLVTKKRGGGMTGGKKSRVGDAIKMRKFHRSG